MISITWRLILTLQILRIYGTDSTSKCNIFLIAINHSFINEYYHDFRHNEGEDEMSEISTISKIDSIKEDFAKVLTDWQEHIGYLQVLLIPLRFHKFLIFNE